MARRQHRAGLPTQAQLNELGEAMQSARAALRMTSSTMESLLRHNDYGEIEGKLFEHLKRTVDTALAYWEPAD